MAWDQELSSGLMLLTFMTENLFSSASQLLSSPMGTWDEKFAPGLMLLTFMSVQLFQFHFARLAWRLCFQTNTVAEDVLLSALSHIFAGLRRT